MPTAPPSLLPFFTYYGGKWRSAPRYPAPLHPLVVEPFAGSAGYALRHAARDVLLADADPLVAGLWSWLVRVPEADVLGLPAVVGTVDDVHLCEEARWLVGFWLNKGTTQPGRTPSAWMRGAVRPGGFWGPEVRERVARQLRAIRHWRVRCCSWADLDPGALGPATWFVDPPYCGPAGRRYRRHAVDYAALGAWCRWLPGQALVCEAEGAAWLPFRPHIVAKAAAGRGRAGVCREVLWEGGA